MRTVILGLLIAAAAISACNPQKAAVKNPKPAATPNRVTKQDSAIITISRSPCYGHCPTYTMSIFANGAVRYEGQRDVPKIGLYVRSIPRDSVQALAKQFEAADIFNLEDKYPNLATDLPTTYVTYRKGIKVKMVTGIRNAPQPFLDIVTTLYQIADEEDGWLKTGNLPMQK